MITNMSPLMFWYKCPHCEFTIEAIWAEHVHYPECNKAFATGVADPFPIDDFFGGTASSGITPRYFGGIDPY